MAGDSALGMRISGTAVQPRLARYSEQGAGDPTDADQVAPLQAPLGALGIAAGIIVVYVCLLANWRRFSRIMHWVIVIAGIVIAGCGVYFVVMLLAIIA